jgi:RNA polymerase sigma factor (sigma-70 family)
VLNGCRSVLRRRAAARRVGAAHRDEPPAKSAENEVILSEDRRQVLAALARLPRRRRELLVLRYYLGLSEAEIAAVLGISPGTVKSTAARGLAALARDLGEQSRPGSKNGSGTPCRPRPLASEMTGCAPARPRTRPRRRT